MGAVAGTRSLDGRRQADTPARFHERDHILGPATSVKVHCEEPAGLILEERVYAHDMSTCEVAEYRGVVERNERLIQALAALYFGQFAYAPDELVSTRRSISALPGLLTHESGWEDVHTSAK